MRALFDPEQLKKDLSAYIPLVCIIVVMMLTASCSTVSTKQTSSTNTAANSLTTKEKTDNEKTANAMDKLECRTVEATGSRFKRKVCERKEIWAAIDKKNKKEADQFIRRIEDQSGIVTGGRNDSAGGTTNTPMNPGGL